MINCILKKNNIYSIFQGYLKNERENARTKHIDIRYHFIRDWYEKGYFSLKSVEGSMNIADIFTKWLSSQRIIYLCSTIFDYEAILC